jgi:hypothetical protein
LVPTGRHAAEPSIPDPLQVPIGPMDDVPISNRVRITVAAVATVVLAGSGVAVYLAVRPGNGAASAGANQIGARLQASLPTTPPSAGPGGTPPSTGDPTPTGAVTPRPSSPSPSASSGAGVPRPSPRASSPSPSPSATAVTPVDLALGRPITASGSSSSPPANAVDGDSVTVWQGATGPGGSLNRRTQRITVDLGTPASIGRIVLCLPPQAAWPARTETLSISGGTSGGADDVSYQTIVGATGYTFDPATGNTVTITVPPVDVRYVQFEVSANTGASAGQLSEIEIFAS